MIEFKWDTMSKPFHMIGCFAHLFYMSILVLYTNLVYVKGNASDASQNNNYSILLLVGTIYPTLYDISQAFRVGMT